jgi:magnesium transporter
MQIDMLKTLDGAAAAAWIATQDDVAAKEALLALGPRQTSTILALLPAERCARLLASVPADLAGLWRSYGNYAEDTVGKLLERPAAVFAPEARIQHVVDQLRESVKKTFITYIFVVDSENRLVGIATFRELLYASPQQRIEEIMVRNPYALDPHMRLVDAMRDVVKRHYPVYPVVGANGVLVGQVRGQVLFEAQAVEISAQAGQLVGVEKEERLHTSWKRSFLSRHPWLQLNLLTAFIAGAVVSLFEASIDKIALLAVFLPILAGQSGNTGCQALAVTLRGLTLGEVGPKDVPRLLQKEGLLGLLNGAVVGLVAGIAMYCYARYQNHPSALGLAAITWVSMIGSCVASGLAGASVPLTLKRLGADPATASSIFLTTATDVASMGIFLGLATVLLL